MAFERISILMLKNNGLLIDKSGNHHCTGVQHVFTVRLTTVRQTHPVGVHANKFAINNLFGFEMVFG